MSLKEMQPMKIELDKSQLWLEFYPISNRSTGKIFLIQAYETHVYAHIRKILYNNVNK